MGLAFGHFKVVQSPNQEVGRIRNSLGTDLREAEQGVIFSHKRGFWQGGSAGLKKVGIQGLLGTRGCGQTQKSGS